MITLNSATPEIVALMAPEYVREHIDEFGTPKAYNHYAVGWAHAMDTPYQWTKQVASHWGGTRNGTIVSLADRHQGEGRDPQSVPSRDRRRADGARSRGPARAGDGPRRAAEAARRGQHGLLVRRCPGPRAARDSSTSRCSSTAASTTRAGRPSPAQPAVAEDPVAGLRRRRLGAVRPDDWTQAHDLSKEKPQKLHELQRLFLIEAVKYNVLPLDDRQPERFNTDLAGRPELIKGNSQLLFAGMGRLTENVVLNLKNRSHAVTAEVVFPDGAPGGANGTIIAQGGAFGGWSLYTRDGRLKYCYNLLGINRYYVESDSVLPAGKHEVRMEFTYDGGGLGRGGSVTLYLDGSQIGAGRIGLTQPLIYSWTKPRMSAARPAQRSPRITKPGRASSTGGSTGSSWTRA